MIVFAFLLNCLFNFAIGIVAAKILGPAEFGHYSLAMSMAIVLQSLGFDWLRLSALRFYSNKRNAERPEIRSTLVSVFTALAIVAMMAAAGIVLLEPWLPDAARLVPLSIAVAAAFGLFEMFAALLRAGFQNRDYSYFVIAKNVLALTLSSAGALYFHSAEWALAGLVVSIMGSFAMSRLMSHEKAKPLRFGGGGLVGQFAVYGFPIVIANVFYQAIPLVDRAVLSQTHDFAQAGQMALAFDIGVRGVGSIGSVLDILLFQLAVAAEHEFGAAAASRQVSRNMGLVFAVLTPVVAGLWLVTPSLDILIIPEAYRSHFTRYFEILLPGFFCSALINQCFSPAFQILHRTAPLLCAGAVAFAANAAAMLLLPPSADASAFVEAQSLSSLAGLLTVLVFLRRGEQIWPPLRDVLGTLTAAALMAVAVWPLRAMTPGLAAMSLQMVTGCIVYGLIVLGFDVAGLRRLFRGLLSGTLFTKSPSGIPAAAPGEPCDETLAA